MGGLGDRHQVGAGRRQPAFSARPRDTRPARAPAPCRSARRWRRTDHPFETLGQQHRELSGAAAAVQGQAGAGAERGQLVDQPRRVGRTMCGVVRRTGGEMILKGAVMGLSRNDPGDHRDHGRQAAALLGESRRYGTRLSVTLERRTTACGAAINCKEPTVIPGCFIRLPERRTQPRRPPCPVASPSTQTEAPGPAPGASPGAATGPRRVWLEQAAIGVNPLDLGQRSGAAPIPLPSGLGLEGAGVVAALGPGVSGLAPGDRVAMPPAAGRLCQRPALPRRALAEAARHTRFRDAAALLFKGITAHYLLHATYPVGPAHASCCTARRRRPVPS